MTIKTINQFVEEIERRTEWGKYKTENLDGAHYLAMKDLQKELNEKNDDLPIMPTQNIHDPGNVIFGPVIIGKFSD